VDCFPVRKQNDPQISSSHLCNWRPPTNPAILLNDFFHRVVNDMLNPFFLDHGAIWALMHRMEVLGEFHSQQSTRDCNFVKSRRPRHNDFR